MKTIKRSKLSRILSEPLNKHKRKLSIEEALRIGIRFGYQGNEIVEHFYEKYIELCERKKFEGLILSSRLANILELSHSEVFRSIGKNNYSNNQFTRGDGEVFYVFSFGGACNQLTKLGATDKQLGSFVRDMVMNKEIRSQ